MLEKINMKRIVALLTALLPLCFFTACSQEKPVGDAASPKSSATAKPAASEKTDIHATGTVVETMNTGGYTYVQIDTGSEKLWAAAPECLVKVGDRLAVPEGTPMRNFHSKTLKRVKVNGSRTPWTKAEQKKNDLLKRLRDAEQQQDFFSGLYRQYTTNLLKLVIYVRMLLHNQQVRQYLEERHSLSLKLIEQIIQSTER